MNKIYVVLNFVHTTSQGRLQQPGNRIENQEDEANFCSYGQSFYL